MCVCVWCHYFGQFHFGNTQLVSKILLMIYLIIIIGPGRMGGERLSPPTRQGCEARLVLELKLVYC